MSDEMLSPLIGSSLRVQDREQLEEFLEREDAADVVKKASFEEVFFAVRHIGLADAMELLPLITSKQVRGFIDLECWHKDEFVPKPFMEWVAAFIQAGPEETVRALSGIDELVIALFLKDITRVFEVDRDDPPESTQMIFTPDNRFGVEPLEDNEATKLGMLILDALFKYYPALGSRILTCARFMTRMELEETAFDNKNRRLEVHGFVDYFEAMSIYSGPEPNETFAPSNRIQNAEGVPGEERTGTLPALFADSLMDGAFLMKVFAQVTDPVEADRFAEQLTALGNRILSANLVNLGEIEGMRPALSEMRDFLTIGFEHLTAGNPEAGVEVLRKTYVQSVFKVGFDLVARLRNQADKLAQLPGFRLEMFDADDQAFVAGLRRFKPLLFEKTALRGFRSLADVEAAKTRLAALTALAEAFITSFGKISDTLGRMLNTATVRFAIYGQFDPAPLTVGDVESWVAGGLVLPEMTVPTAIQPFAVRWWKEMRSELKPLVGKKIDPRYVASLAVKL